MMRDKNDKQILKDCFICIEGMNTPFLVSIETSLGIKLENENPLPIEVLKDNYKKESNCIGFVPILFLKSEKIFICPISEYPECHV